MPPTMTATLGPAPCSAASFSTSSGTRVLCPAAWLETPMHVDVVLHRHAGGLFRGLEERAHVHVEAQVREGGGDDLHAPVVSVLAELHHEHAGPATLVLGELRPPPCRDLLEIVVAVVGGAVDPGHGLHVGGCSGCRLLLQGLGDLAHAWPGPGRPPPRPRAGCPSPLRASSLRWAQAALAHLVRIARGADPLEAPDLGLAHRRVVDVADLDLVFLGRAGTC